MTPIRAAIVWRQASKSFVDVTTASAINNNAYSFSCPSVAAGKPLRCYCACAIPTDTTRWVLALAQETEEHHVPWHAVEFRFPFQLPLYPESDVLFVCVSVVQFDAKHALRPFYLCCTPPADVECVHPLTVDAWTSSEQEWHAGIAAMGGTASILSIAFDNLWDCTVHGLNGDGGGPVDVDDTFLSTDAIEEVDCETSVLGMQASLSRTVSAALESASVGTEESHGVALQDDANDDEDVAIDVHTGLTASSVACTDDNDDDMESIDGDTDGESDDVEEDEDEEEDDDDDIIE